MTNISDKPLLLLVDDEPHARILMRRYLNNICRIIEAESTESALSILLNEKPDLILSDIRMPGENGFVLLQKLRMDYPNIPAILVTGHADKSIAISAVKNGAFDFIEKPFEKDELITSVKQAIDFIEIKNKAARAELVAIDSQRLASFGLLAGSIAHDISTPLSIILSKSEKLFSNLEKKVQMTSEEIQKFREVYNSAAEKIFHVLKSLKAVSYANESPEYELHSLENIVDDAIVLSRMDPRHNRIIINVNLCSNDLNVYCNKIEITQVVYNLISNSMEAIKECDKKWISVDVIDINEDYIKVSIIDSGLGIDEKIIDKIFEPFFTTNSIAKFTGLGLCTCKRLIEEHKGRIILDTKCKNTKFDLLLPKHSL